MYKHSLPFLNAFSVCLYFCFYLLYFLFLMVLLDTIFSTSLKTPSTVLAEPNMAQVEKYMFAE